ncbi:MAG: exodeoxyribonuclease VII small subunit [Anaerolineae bacterium]|nr:exodeoxyribonuclease VII small subunit [Anaerolineae bacterium]
MSNTNELSFDELSFEAAYTELQAVIEKLESGELSLDESVNLYERGRLLSLHCQSLLDNAELRIKQVNQDGSLSD